MTGRFWRRVRDSNPRNGCSRLHDFQSCSFGQLGQLSIAMKFLLSQSTSLVYHIQTKKASVFWKKIYQIFFRRFLLNEIFPSLTFPISSMLQNQRSFWETSVMKKLFNVLSLIVIGRITSERSIDDKPHFLCGYMRSSPHGRFLSKEKPFRK